MAFYFVSTFANAQTPTKQRPYGYRGLKIFTSLKLRFQDFQRWSNKRLRIRPRLDHSSSAVSHGRADSLQKAQGNLPIRSAR
ncbi:hypothetical protein [Bathymodiolus japonicus methanotrophic gill symbiont]|uniref:hypothetical protein n=1 Tax=Bathymodiolus japonicus methanotrophic gill symbiont TaxID=113269 RepID=UPI001C8EB5AF|nr:hypothetical protein [Bathymodiolus japonicus methanotrophic gill symbiont]